MTKAAAGDTSEPRIIAVPRNIVTATKVVVSEHFSSILFSIQIGSRDLRWSVLTAEKANKLRLRLS